MKSPGRGSGRTRNDGQRLHDAFGNPLGLFKRQQVSRFRDLQEMVRWRHLLPALPYRLHQGIGVLPPDGDRRNPATAQPGQMGCQREIDAGFPLPVKGQFTALTGPRIIRRDRHQSRAVAGIVLQHLIADPTEHRLATEMSERLIHAIPVGPALQSAAHHRGAVRGDMPQQPQGSTVPPQQKRGFHQHDGPKQIRPPSRRHQGHECAQ